MINIYKIILAGTPDFPLPIFEKLINNNNFDIIGIVTQPDRINQRNKKILFSPIKKLAIKYQIKLFQPEKINAIFDQLKVLDFDLLLTCAYGQFIADKVLSLPKFGSLNIHASLLPRLRGGAPIHHAVINGDQETGITLMRMEKKMDAGDILLQASIRISQTDTVGDVYNQLSKLATDNIENWLNLFFNNKCIARKQIASQATFGLNISKADRYIKWSNSAEMIYNQIRGLNPWPIAITNCEGTAFKVTQAELIEKSDSDKLLAGSIISVDEKGILIQTNSSQNILITELIWPYKQKMKVAKFIKGNQVFQIKKILN